MDHLIFALPQENPYLAMPFPDGITPLDYAIRRVREASGDTMPVTALLPAASGGSGTSTLATSLPEDWSVIVLEEEGAAAALARIDAALPGDVEHLVWVDGDAPFTSVSLTAYLLELHRRSWCDYTFADGYPQGYAPQILRREILPALASLAESRSLRWNRTILFDTLSVDINSFDIETEASSEDYSLLRASLTVANRADYVLCRRLAQRCPEVVTMPAVDPFTTRYPDRDDPLLRILLDDPVILRTLPRYYMIQVSESLSQKPLYTPWGDPRWNPAERGDTPRNMDASLFSTIVEQIARESPEATVALGYRGEPGMYNGLEECARILKAHPGLTVYLETSGVGWDDDNLLTLEKWDTLGALIVELDAATPETYRTIRGEGWEEARRFIERFSVTHADRLYVQATRMKENENELQLFFRHWSDTGNVQPLIQKYNDFAGRLPDRRVADLQPLKRTPCRHLEREMVILVDGRVPRCHQDLEVEELLGDLRTGSLVDAWEAGESQYRLHLQSDYPQLCRLCDEYYTINA
jgi:spiro-SPASM protein